MSSAKGHYELSKNDGSAIDAVRATKITFDSETTVQSKTALRLIFSHIPIGLL